MNFLLNKSTSCNRCALAQDFSVFLNLSHFCLHYGGILSAGEKYGKGFAFKLNVHLTQTEEEKSMKEIDSSASGLSEKVDLNQASNAEEIKRNNLANQGGADRKEEKGEDIQTGNLANQGGADRKEEKGEDIQTGNPANQSGADRKDAKVEDIQNENFINQSGEEKEFIDDAGVYHGPIVEVHGYKGDTVGGAMSSREAIEYTDNNGRVHRGFFTPEKRETSFYVDWRDLKAEVIKEFPEYKNIINQIATNDVLWKEFLTAGKKDFLAGGSKNVDVWLGNYENMPKEPVFKKLMEKLAVEVYSLNNLHGLYEIGGIEEGDIIAKRASAMTDVAMELGYPNLLANSYRLTLSRNGEQIPGVFIEAADLDTVDKSKWRIDDPIFAMPENEFDNPKFLKSLADLQILDYLCGNIDRHKGNFFVRQDTSDPEKPHLIGVQGIDNDLSFGGVLGGQQQLARQENLMVISSEMAEAILKLTDNKLKEIMEKNGLTNKNDYAFAVTRLQILRSRINGRKEDVKKRKEEFDKKIKTSSLKPGKTEDDYLYEPRLKKREITLENELVMDKNGQYVPLKIEDVRLNENENSILIVQNDKYWEKLSLDILVPVKYTFDDGTNKWKRKQEPEKNIFCVAQLLRENVKNAKKIVEQKKARIKQNPKKQKISNLSANNYTTHTMIIDFKHVRKLMQEEYRKYLEIQKEFNDAGGENPERSKYFKRMKAAYEDIIEGYRKIEPVFKEAEAWPGHVIGELKKFYNELSVKRATALSKTEKYLSNANWRWWKKTDDYQERIEIAKRLKVAVENTPSQELFQNQLSYQEKKQDKLAKEDPAVFSSFMKEQMFGLMSGTLYQNYMALPHNDPKRQNANNAFKAQKRLWEYASTQWKEGNKQKQGDSAEKAMYDVDIILKYAPELKEEMERQGVSVTCGEGKGLSPAQALRALNVLHQKEYNIAKERRQTELGVEKKNAPGKEHSHADMNRNKMKIEVEERDTVSEVIRPKKGKEMIRRF